MISNPLWPCLLVFTLFSCPVYAQSNQRADSLEALLSTEKNDLKRAELLCELSLTLRTIDFQKSLEVAQKAESAAEKANNPSLKAKSQLFQGVELYYQGHHDKALEKYLQAFEQYETVQDKQGMAAALNELGTLHKKQNDLDLAQQSFQQALDLSIDLRDSAQMANSMNNLGIVYELREDYQKAMDLYVKSSVIKEKLHDKNGLGYNYDNMGALLGKLGRFKEAQYYSEKVIDLRKELGDKSGYAISLNNMGELLVMKGDYGKAREFLEQSLVIAKEIDFKDLRRYTLSVIAESYKAEGNYKDALAYTTQSVNLKDSIFTEHKSQQMEELKAQYEAEKKENEIKNLQHDNQLNQILIGALAFLLLALASVGWLWQNRLKLKQKAELETTRAEVKELQLRAVITSQEEERKRFAEDLHDGLGQMISAARLNLTADTLEQQSADRVVNILNDMNAEIRNIAFNLMPQVLLTHNLPEALTEFATRINRAGTIQVSVKTFEFTMEIPDSIKVSLYRVCQEWVNNVIKYSGCSRIELQLVEHPDERVITIEDDGEGFDISRLQLGQGNGWKNINSRLGLIGGSIEIDSAPGKRGTTVIIAIPAEVAEPV